MLLEILEDIIRDIKGKPADYTSKARRLEQDAVYDERSNYSVINSKIDRTSSMVEVLLKNDSLLKSEVMQPLPGLMPFIHVYDCRFDRKKPVCEKDQSRS